MDSSYGITRVTIYLPDGTVKEYEVGQSVFVELGTLRECSGSNPQGGLYLTLKWDNAVRDYKGIPFVITTLKKPG